MEVYKESQECGVVCQRDDTLKAEAREKPFLHGLVGRKHQTQGEQYRG